MMAWAEDMAPRGNIPSADPGAKTGAGVEREHLSPASARARVGSAGQGGKAKDPRGRSREIRDRMSQPTSLRRPEGIPVHVGPRQVFDVLKNKSARPP